MASESKPAVMTQAECARHSRKSRQYISQLAKAGVLVMRGSKIDVRATDTVLDDKPVEDVPEPPAATTAPPSRMGTDSLPQAGGASFGQARTIEMVFRAKLRRLEFETKQGRLIEAEAVRKRIAEHVRALRDGLLGLPDRLSSSLAAENDPRKIHVLLKTELTRELEALAQAIGGMAA
jgi:hypothetical protein